MVIFGAETQLMLPEGWVAAGGFNEQSGIITVAAGAGVNAVAQQSVLSRDIPAGAKIFLRYLSFRIVDMAGFDQLYFSLKRNGGKVIPWDKISGEQTKEDFRVPIDEVYDAGLIEIGATNISGTAESGASENPGDIRVIARFQGLLLRERARSFGG